MRSRAIAPVHPGEILREEFLDPLGLSAYRVAKDLDVPLPRVNDIVNEKRGISSEMSLLLARYFGVSENFFSTLQADYDLRIARQALKAKLARVKPFSMAAI